MPDEQQTNKRDGQVEGDDDQEAGPLSAVILITVVVVLILGLGLLATTAYFDVNEKSYRIKFFVESSLNLLILVAVLVQAYVYTRQWSAMERSLERTDQVIEMTQGQLVAMNGQLESMKEQAGLMRDSLAQNKTAMEQSSQIATAQGIVLTEQLLAMQEQAWAMKGQLAAIQKQAGVMSDALTETRNLVAQNERVIEVAEENTRVFEKMAIDTNRAYITAVIDTIEEGFQFHLHIANSGNTPANDVRVFYGFGLREEPPFKKTEDGRLTVDGSYAREEGFGVIAPKSSLTLRTPKCGQMSGSEFQRWKLSQVRFYCWGMIRYQDFFNQKHLSWFCFYQGQTAPKGATYEHGNQAR